MRNPLAGPEWGAWNERREASFAALFRESMAVLDADLRPPLPTEQEDDYAAAHPEELELGMDQRLLVQLLREMQKRAHDGPYQIRDAKDAASPCENPCGQTLSPPQFGNGHAASDGTVLPVASDDLVKPGGALLSDHGEEPVIFGSHAASSASGGETVNGGGEA